MDVQLPDPRNENILIYVGGELLPRNEAKVSVFDSSVQGGDAVWEGLRIYNGKIFMLDAHLDRLFESADRSPDRLNDRLVVGAEDLPPDRRVGPGDAGGVAQARSQGTEPLGAGATLEGELVGKYMWQVADDRHRPVMLGRLDRHRSCAEAGNQFLDPVVEQPGGALGRGQVPACALVQVGPRVDHACGFRARQWVAADESFV